MGHGSIRIFVSARLAAGASFAATAQQAHYLLRVMRRRDGETVALFNGDDGEWSAALATDGRSLRFTVGERLRAQAPDADLWLAFGLLKRDATDLVMRQATELGVTRICPVLARRSQGERVNLARLQAIAIEAAEQSERLTLPTIDPPQTLAALLGTWPPARPLVALVERAHAPLIRPASGASGLLVGPEGGFAPEEIAEIGRHRWVVRASLGPRILRAETAAIAGLAQLQAGI
ncbi:MAG: 16S rRNA (uracil(1498)-N(3))-methyltransferase [Rhodospirillales bacterium]|nr:16S rRNA (uracil(1498)-N(3))-methyltransferase [Rhodospirillales bacterium]